MEVTCGLLRTYVPPVAHPTGRRPGARDRYDVPARVTGATGKAECVMSGASAKRARIESSSSEPVPSLSDTVLVSILHENAEKRKLVLDELETTDVTQAALDGRRVVKFNDVMELMDAALSNEDNSTEKVIAMCKDLKLPVSEGLKRTRFHEECVDRYGRPENATAKNHVRNHEYIKLNQAADGSKWYIYLGTNESSITHVLKFARDKLGVPDDQIRYNAAMMPGVIQICFRDPSVPPVPPTAVAVENGEDW